MEPWQKLSLSLMLLGVAIALAAALHDVLPTVAYLAILIILCIAFVVCLAWLIIITHPLTYLRKAWQRRRGRKRQEAWWQQRLILIEEWAQRWRELSQLIVQVITCNGEPTDAQEQQFATLRKWFIKNRSDVLAAWQYFWQQRTPMAHEELPKYSLADKILKEHWNDPFSFFYNPPSLWALARALGVQKSTSTWSPSEYEVNWTEVAVRILSERVDEFVAWSKTH